MTVTINLNTERESKMKTIDIKLSTYNPAFQTLADKKPTAERLFVYKRITPTMDKEESRVAFTSGGDRIHYIYPNGGYDHLAIVADRYAFIRYLNEGESVTLANE